MSSTIPTGLLTASILPSPFPLLAAREYITAMRKTLLAFHPYLIALEVLAVLPTSGVLNIQYTKTSSILLKSEIRFTESSGNRQPIGYDERTDGDECPTKGNLSALSCSCRKQYAMMMVKMMLVLSIGATFETSPSCSALK